MKKVGHNVVYYDDEINDDFAAMGMKKCRVDESFKYHHSSLLWNICADVIYHLIAVPLVSLYAYAVLGVRFENRAALRKYRKTPFFLYGNHTGWIDAYTPNMLSAPRRCRIIVAKDTVSIPGIKNLVQMLGAIPIPDDIRGLRHFSEAVEHYHKRSNIAVYPEAHIWPFYNGVRNFSDTSFHYPIKYGAPTFAMFTAYQKPKGFLSFLRKANARVYISDALFADEGLEGAAARKNLRDKVYAFMLDASRHSDYTVVEYIPRSKADSASDTQSESGLNVEKQA